MVSKAGVCTRFPRFPSFDVSWTPDRTQGNRQYGHIKHIFIQEAPYPSPA